MYKRVKTIIVTLFIYSSLFSVKVSALECAVCGSGLEKKKEIQIATRKLILLILVAGGKFSNRIKM
jgi:hypothetical protein